MEIQANMYNLQDNQLPHLHKAAVNTFGINHNEALDIVICFDTKLGDILRGVEVKEIQTTCLPPDLDGGLSSNRNPNQNKLQVLQVYSYTKEL